MHGNRRKHIPLFIKATSTFHIKEMEGGDEKKVNSFVFFLFHSIVGAKTHGVELPADTEVRFHFIHVYIHSHMMQSNKNIIFKYFSFTASMA
jgi:hypothetical protein